MLGAILGIANKFIPDKNKQKQFEKEMKVSYEKTFQDAINADKDIRLAELKTGGIAAKWRPFGAFTVFLILGLYWFVYPLLIMVNDVFWLDISISKLPPLPIEFYGLALAFVSIYAHGRSLEKRIRE